MQLKDQFRDSGNEYSVEYQDADSFADILYENVNQHYGVCFFGDKIVVGWHPKQNRWDLLGGKIESGESFEDTLIREVQEESNMRVLRHQPLGYQKVTREDGSFVYQLRSVCIVEPFGDFMSDPAGGVTKITCIDPQEWDEYIHWKDIGHRILERALEIKNSL